MDHQCGRAGYYWIDNIFCLKPTIEKRLAHNMDTHIVFIDLQKTYDTVPLTMLWQVLKTKGIPQVYNNAVRGFMKYDHTIKIGQKVSQKIMVTKGLRPGCCIAPTLFKIYLEGVLETWRKKCKPMGMQVRYHKLYTWHFADDRYSLHVRENRRIIH